jgi:hypothetical protein
MFDPYSKWLGIPKDQRPVDYFLLLGLDANEKDPTAIRAAAERQAARVSRHQDGPLAQTAARLLKEISQAKSVLLTPATRKAYAEKLRKIASHKAAPEVETEPEAEEVTAEVEEEAVVEAEEEAAPEQRSEGKPRKAGKKGKGRGGRKAPAKEEKGRLWLWVALGGAAVLLIVGGGLTFWLTRPSKEPTPAPSGPLAGAPQLQTPQPMPPVRPQPEPPAAVVPPVKQPPPPEKPAPPVKPTPPPPPPPPPPALSRPAARKVPPRVVKLPVPNQAAQEKAEKAIKETYQADYAKKLPADHLALAAKFLQPGRENRADPAAWFVLLREARDAAVRAGRPRLAVEAIDEIDKWFIVDASAMKQQALESILQAGNEETARAVTRTALSQVERAVDADDYPAALRLADLAGSAAAKGKDGNQISQAKSRREEAQALKDAFALVTTAREKLRQMPDDPAANLTVGRHVCFFKGSWDEGLPLLAKGGQAEAAGLARQDLTPPASVKAQVAIGDRWWDLGRLQAGREKRHLLDRAFAWYALAQPGAPAEDKVRLLDRMGEVAHANAARIPRLQPGSYFGRGTEDRILLLREGGGNMRSEEAVERGLEWLARHQGGSGAWSNDAFHVSGKCNCGDPGQKYDVAGTAFGLLPFLGAGHTPKHGQHARTVQKGLRWLISQQKEAGNFSGNAYENALATIAMCEVYGLTKIPDYGKRAQKALDFIAGGQHAGGSWNYSYNAAAPGDTSITGWQFSALKAGVYGGLTVPPATIARVGYFLDSVADPGGLGYGYNTPGAGKSTTAAGLLAREYLGWWPEHPGLGKPLTSLLRPENFENREKPNLYYIFYATQVMHHAGGESWETWNPKVRDMLLDLQDQGKEPGHEHQKGSWSPHGAEWTKEGGRLMYTSLALLTLETYYYSIPLNGYGPAVLEE